MNSEIYSLSNTEIIRELGSQYRTYRLNSHLKQSSVAEMAGISVVTLRNFETGQANNITLSNLLSLLRIVNRLEAICELLPQIPLSPYIMDKIQSNQPQRIRK